MPTNIYVFVIFFLEEAGYNSDIQYFINFRSKF